jgi:hypothetical protein
LVILSNRLICEECVSQRQTLGSCSVTEPLLPFDGGQHERLKGCGFLVSRRGDKLLGPLLDVPDYAVRDEERDAKSDHGNSFLAEPSWEHQVGELAHKRGVRCVEFFVAHKHSTCQE